MKFAVIKKKKALGVLCLTLALVLMLSLTYLSGSHVLAVGGTTRKLPVYCVKTDEKKVALTFDASWGADKTEAILSTLEDYDIKATFFTVGFWADEHQELLKKLHDSGRMEIGTHSDTHPHMSKLNKSQVELELSSSVRKIEAITGSKVTLFRAPFGEYDDQLLSVAEEQGLKTIQWDVDTLDWKNKTAGEMAARVQKRADCGSIILMHNDGKHTVEALPLIIEGLKNKGFSFVTVGELIYQDNYYIDHTGKQIRKEG